MAGSANVTLMREIPELDANDSVGDTLDGYEDALIQIRPHGERQLGEVAETSNDFMEMSARPMFTAAQMNQARGERDRVLGDMIRLSHTGNLFRRRVGAGYQIVVRRDETAGFLQARPSEDVNFVPNHTWQMSRSLAVLLRNCSGGGSWGRDPGALTARQIQEQSHDLRPNRTLSLITPFARAGATAPADLQRLITILEAVKEAKAGRRVADPQLAVLGADTSRRVLQGVTTEEVDRLLSEARGLSRTHEMHSIWETYKTGIIFAAVSVPAVVGGWIWNRARGAGVANALARTSAAADAAAGGMAATEGAAAVTGAESVAATTASTGFLGTLGTIIGAAAAIGVGLVAGGSARLSYEQFRESFNAPEVDATTRQIFNWAPTGALVGIAAAGFLAPPTLLLTIPMVAGWIGMGEYGIPALRRESEAAQAAQQAAAQQAQPTGQEGQESQALSPEPAPAS